MANVPSNPERAPRRASLVSAMLAMAVISLLLFWLPLLGPLLAGLAGGRAAGGAIRGLLAAILPMAVLCFLLVGFNAQLTDMPVVGVIAGAGLFVLLIFQSLPLLLGALVGGASVR